MKFINIVLTLGITLTVAACGGGGGSGSNASASTSNILIVNVNKDGIYQTSPYATSTNLTQNSTSGYFVSAYIREEWSGSGLGYTSGYVNPTSGTLNSYSVTNQSTGDFLWSISNANYDISKTTPSLDASQLPFNAISAAVETKFYGGSNNDKTLFLINTSEVDLGSGNDTLVLSQTYTTYQFTKIPGSTTSIYVTRDGHQTLVKNVESFQFSNVTKTISEILNSLP